MNPWILDNITKLQDKLAVRDSFGEFTYSELQNQIENYENLISTQVKQGDIVAIHADYNFYSIALFFVLSKLKTIIVPILSENITEVNGRIKIAGCNKVFKFNKRELQSHNLDVDLSGRHELVNELVSKNASGLVLFSSGSTGTPKAMIHNLDNLMRSFKEKRQKDLNILVFLMFDHIGGINTLLNTLSMGATIVLPENRKPKYIASLIERFKINVLPATPTFLNMMLMANSDQDYNLSSLKMITYGTEPMPESLLKKLKEKFPRTRLMQTFGTSETGIVQTSSRSSGSLEMKLNDPNIEHKVVNNELWLRSKTQIMGYLNNNMESFTDDGWFKTGDMVETSKDGHLKIIGRLKEVINVGGEKVLPPEIESTVLEIDFIEDCTAYGLKNAITGQVVAVDIVLKGDMSESNAKKAIRTYCKSKLDNYKVPVKFRFMSKTDASVRFKKMRPIGP